jgi:hypothetical protein
VSSATIDGAADHDLAHGARHCARRSHFQAFLTQLLGRTGMRALALMPFLLLGCAHPEGPSVSDGMLAGSYMNGDPVVPRTLLLHDDHAFEYFQLTNSIGPREGAGVEWGYYGRWVFRPPDCVELHIGEGADVILVYVRAHSGSDVAILEPDLFPGILAGWDPVRTYEYLTKQQPSRLPAPKPALVMPPEGPERRAVSGADR